jgi:GH15 family glucan-1,4-alpha-glucosidase
MYDIYGRNRVTERLLPHLAGYRGAQPVRVGNDLSQQTQHDVYGEVTLAILSRIQQHGTADRAERRLLGDFAKVICENWRKPDNGIWEIRDRQRHYTHSKVMCWCALDRLVDLHERGILSISNDIQHERAALRDEIEGHAIDVGRDCYVGVFDTEIVDAALLWLPACGYIPYDHPRMINTWRAIQNDLGENGLIHRYPSGFGHSEPGEAVFIICNFWAVDYLIGRGLLQEAKELLERLLSCANDLGLYSEAIDAASGTALGNLPQAFSHASAINTILTLEAAQRARLEC